MNQLHIKLNISKNTSINNDFDTVEEARKYVQDLFSQLDSITADLNVVENALKNPDVLNLDRGVGPIELTKQIREVTGLSVSCSHYIAKRLQEKEKDNQELPPPDWKPSEELLARARRTTKVFEADLDLGGPREEAAGRRLIAQDEEDT